MRTLIKVRNWTDIEVLLCHLMAGWQFAVGDKDNLLSVHFTGIQENPENIPVA